MAVTVPRDILHFPIWRLQCRLTTFIFQYGGHSWVLEYCGSCCAMPHKHFFSNITDTTEGLHCFSVTSLCFTKRRIRAETLQNMKNREILCAIFLWENVLLAWTATWKITCLSMSQHFFLHSTQSSPHSCPHMQNTNQILDHQATK